MTFLAATFLWLLLAIPLVILLHFVRSRPQKKQVSASFLWQQAKNLAKQKNRFISTWLLLLQILFIALLTLALAQPRLVTESLEQVFIIDASASMATANVKTGQRLARAIKKVEDLLTGEKIALVRAGLDATLLQNFTSDYSKVKTSLQNLQVGDAYADIKRAITLAKTIAPQAELHLLSDSIPPEGLDINFHPITDSAQNIGITSFKLQGKQIFLSILNTSTRPYEIPIQLYFEQQLIASSNLLVPSLNQAYISFPITGESGTYSAHLTAPDWDGLELDNQVFLAHKQLQVLISPPESTFEKALTAIPNLKVRVSNRINGIYDVLVTSNLFTNFTNLESGRYIIYAPLSSNPQNQLLIDWESTHPILRFVDLTATSIKVANANLTTNNKFNWQTLAQSEDLSPALLYLATPETTAVVLNFHPNQSNLSRRSAFPILTTNIMRQFEQNNNLPLGTPLVAKKIVLNGETTISKRAYIAGIYNLDNVIYSANLLSPRESHLKSIDVKLITTNKSQQVPLTKGIQNVKSNQAPEFWLLVLALGLLVIEYLWWLALKYQPSPKSLFKYRSKT